MNLHLVNIHVSGDIEANLQAHRAVVAIDRLHVDHVFRAVHLLLDRSSDRLLDGEGVGAGIRRDGLDTWRHDFGELRYRQAKDHHGASDHEEDRNHDRDDRASDEKS